MSQPSILSSDTRYELNPSCDDLPFACELSLAPLIEFWQQSDRHAHPLHRALNTKIQKTLQDAPTLLEPITDLSMLDDHRELLDSLMSIVFPPASWDTDFTAALIPFHMQSFYATPAFERLMLADNGYVCGRMNVDEQTVNHVKLLHTYAFILFMVYGIELDFEYPLIFSASDPETGLDRHFRLNFDGQFMRVKTLRDIKPLSDTDKKRLLNHLTDPQLLMELVPPDAFVISGFAILHAIEVTDHEVLSTLKRDLIEKESIISNERFISLQDKLRTLFRKPDLSFGLAALHGDQVLILNYGSNMEHG